MKLAIVIVHYNASADLGRCLDSLRRCAPEIARATVVVDNASSDPGLAAVREAHGEVRWLMNARNAGFARGCNQGMQEFDSEYALLLNPDIVVQPGALEALLEAADAHPRAGIVGPQLLNEDGGIQDSCRRFYTLGTLLLRRTFLGRIFPRSHTVARHLMHDFDHRTTRTVDWVLGGCLLVRREAVARVGPLDERFFLYFEDVDWCYRMGQAGYDVLYAPEARFVHRHRRDSAGGPMRRSFWLHLASLISFYEKWGMVVYLLKRWRDPLGTWLFWLFDVAALNLSLLGAYLLRRVLNPWFADPLLPLAWYRPLFVFATLLTTLGFLLLGRYRRRDRGRGPGAAARLQQVAAVTLLLWASTYMSHQHVYSRVVLLLFAPLSYAALGLGERLFRRLRERMERGYLSLERTLLVGPSAAIAEWLADVGDPRREGLDPVGYLSPEAEASSPPLRDGDVPCLGTDAGLERVVERHRIAQVVFWSWPEGGLRELRALARLRGRRIRLRWRLDAAALLHAGARAEGFGGRASAVLDPGPAVPALAAAGRAAALIAGLVLLPVSALVGGVGRLLPSVTARRFRVRYAGEAGERTLVLMCTRDGRPRGLVWQKALAVGLVRGQLAWSGFPLAPAAAEDDAPPSPGALGDLWLLAPPTAGLTGSWAGAGFGRRFRTAWCDPAGISRLSPGNTLEEEIP